MTIRRPQVTVGCQASRPGQAACCLSQRLRCAQCSGPLQFASRMSSQSPGRNPRLMVRRPAATKTPSRRRDVCPADHLPRRRPVSPVSPSRSGPVPGSSATDGAAPGTASSSPASTSPWRGVKVDLGDGDARQRGLHLPGRPPCPPAEVIGRGRTRHGQPAAEQVCTGGASG